MKKKLLFLSLTLVTSSFYAADEITKLKQELHAIQSQYSKICQNIVKVERMYGVRDTNNEHIKKILKQSEKIEYLSLHKPLIQQSELLYHQVKALQKRIAELKEQQNQND